MRRGKASLGWAALLCSVLLVTSALALNCNNTVTQPDTVAKLTVAEINFILAQHNEARMRVVPSAVTMNMLKWSTALAALARAFVNECRGMVHSNQTYRTQKAGFYYVGENIAGGPRYDKNGWGTSIRLWEDEKYFYTYADTGCTKTYICGTCRSGEICTHYTQLVWANTTEVGCAYTYCSPDPDGLNHYYICEYGSGGNINSFPPYAQGTPGPNTCSNATPAPTTGATGPTTGATTSTATGQTQPTGGSATPAPSTTLGPNKAPADAPSSAGAIAGGVIAALICVVAGVGGFVYWRRRSTERKARRVFQLDARHQNFEQQLVTVE